MTEGVKKCGGPPFDIDISGVGRDATGWGLLTEGRKRWGGDWGDCGRGSIHSGVQLYIPSAVSCITVQWDAFHGRFECLLSGCRGNWNPTSIWNSIPQSSTLHWFH